LTPFVFINEEQKCLEVLMKSNENRQKKKNQYSFNLQQKKQISHHISKPFPQTRMFSQKDS